MATPPTTPAAEASAAPSSLDRRRAQLADAPVAISADRVGKTFRIPHQQYHTLKERALHPFRARTFDELQAFHDFSFEIKQGEFFGIVGRNGSGKSTLLKCLAGIYQFDRGEAHVHGRLSPFIELGVGFNPDLTARDNVIINAIMLGLTRKQARERFDAIIEFAELQDFLDLKLKNYSSGMSVRLAFATAIEVNADVLLVDEVLAVGDAAFQQKCFEAFQELKNQGRTIVLVTHDMSAVQRFCDRAMLMEKGELLDIGDPRSIARQYNEINFGRLAQSLGDDDRYGDHVAAEIVTAWFEDARGEEVSSLAQGEPLSIVTEVHFHTDMENPVFSLTLRNDARATIFTVSSLWTHGPTGSFRAGDRVRVRVRMDNPLAPSLYSVSPSIAHDGSGQDAIDLREDLARLRVHATRFTGGVVDLPHTWSVEPL